MVLRARLASKLGDEQWRVPILCGVPAAGLSLLLYVFGGGPMDLTPMVAAAVAAGYLADARDRQTTARIGRRTGLIGGSPAAVTVFESATAVVGLSAPNWFQGIAAVTVVTAAALFVALAVGLGVLGALVGRWLADRVGRSRGPLASG